jgi:hypothetical protein
MHEIKRDGFRVIARKQGPRVRLIAPCLPVRTTLVIITTAEAANQVSYAEGNGGSRVWALLYGCAKEILSSAGGFANSFHGRPNSGSY